MSSQSPMLAVATAERDMRRQHRSYLKHALSVLETKTDRCLGSVSDGGHS